MPHTHYIEAIRNTLLPHTEEQFARWSEDYMRNQFAFMGVRTPILRDILKKFWQTNGLPARHHLEPIVTTLWDMPEREYQKVAMELLVKMKKQLTVADVPFLQRLIEAKSWWDTIDVISPKLIGHLYLSNPLEMHTWTDRWIASENFWLQRTAILFQLHYKQKTDEMLLYHYITLCASSDEFFVQKAIGWALREYAKVNADSVLTFVDAHELKPLSRREAIRRL